MTSHTPKYDAKAVEKVIKKGPRITGREAKLIHALLKGHQKTGGLKNG